MIKVIGLGRKSPDDKEDTEKSLKNQRQLFEDTAKQKDWKLVKVFEDYNISGSKRSRKGFDEAIKYIKSHDDVNIVLVKDSSRFIRDSSFFRDFLIDMLAIGKRFYSIMKGGFLDPYDLGDKVMAVVDEEAINKGRKYAEISEKMKIENRLPCIPAPFGYQYNWVKDSKGNERPINKSKDLKDWVQVPKEAKIVIGVVSDYSNSRYYKDSLKDYKIDKGKYYRILKNAKLGLYSGYCVYNKKIKDSTGDVIREEEVKYQIDVEPIISEELFERVNK